jgi:hypothetical protein
MTNFFSMLTPNAGSFLGRVDIQRLQVLVSRNE